MTQPDGPPEVGTDTEMDETIVQEGRPSFTDDPGSEVRQELLALGLTGDKYTVEERIAQGGMGAIYRVFDKGLKRDTVLKVVLPDVMRKPELLSRFVIEARITGQLEHPNIIPVHDIGVIGEDKLYFAMKLIVGEELGWMLKKIRAGDQDVLRKYSIFSLLTIFRKVCDAVGFAHSNGILHRDIKPDNIMIGDYGEVLLVDWGLARRMDEPDSAEGMGREEDLATMKGEPTAAIAVKTRDGVVKGTPAYMAPEQATGKTSEINERTDIFLLGATLYAIATLNAPYTGDDIYEMVINAENGNFVHPSVRAPERLLPDELCRIILKAMAHKPEDRYQTAAELSEDIDALLEGRAVSVRKDFAAGQLLMREGDVGEEAYVIVTGEVEIYKTINEKQVMLVHLTDGDVVGEMAMIAKAPRSATVKAVKDTEVVVITDELMKQGLSKLPPWMGRTVEALVNRLRVANANVHPLMAGNCIYHVLNQVRLIYPHWATPGRDNFTQQMVLTLHTANTIQEISDSLCLDRARVALAFSKLLETPLIKPFGNDSFTIPNYELFCYFTDLARVESGVETQLQDDRNAILYAGANEVLISLCQGDAKETNADDLEPVLGPGADEIMGCADADEITAKLQQLLTSLVQAVRAPPLGPK